MGISWKEEFFVWLESFILCLLSKIVMNCMQKRVHDNDNKNKMVANFRHLLNMMWYIFQNTLGNQVLLDASTTKNVLRDLTQKVKLCSNDAEKAQLWESIENWQNHSAQLDPSEDVAGGIQKEYVILEISAFHACARTI